MTAVNKKFGFEKGWKMIPQGEVNTVKEELKEALGITTDQALLPRRKGLIFMEYLPAIITAIGAIIIAWFAYNQKTKDAMTTYNIEKWKAETEKTMAESTAVYANIYSLLHSLVHELNADRVYIIQPHPPIDTLYLSVTLEVLHPYRDVTKQKSNMQDLPVTEWGWLNQKLQEEYIAYPDINMIPDLHTRSEFSMQGIKSIVCVRLLNSKGRWIGNLCADFTHRKLEGTDIPSIKKSLMDDANLIQYKLPEYSNILNAH